ncbi:MAG: NADH:flavin oxidoreductase [Chloroflexi bacterium]|nr:MAG: NADH:flavin oxidoreductase [Chloroflexota bacterium]
MTAYRRVAQLRTADDFRAYLTEIGAELPFDDELQSGPDSPLAHSHTVHDFTIGNRFCVLPMEGWDGTPDGRPTELVKRRWRNFGRSGAKLVWGGEAVAVRHDGRANPLQLVLDDDHLQDITQLRELLVKTHEAQFGSSSDLFTGLQLTHSGRFARPNHKTKLEPFTLYRHPILDAKFNITDDSTLMSDDDISRLIDEFVHAATLVQQAGFDFVDIKHCHGYLGHEFLSAVDRPGKYGGSFENRTRFLREVVAGVRAEAPGLHIGVRLSAVDCIPYQPGEDGIGVPVEVEGGRYPYAFGSDETGKALDFNEPNAFLKLLFDLDIRLVCITVGSPYYNPHIQRPALFPPSDGYQPPEDPLVGVARQIYVTQQLKQAHPELTIVGSGYSYLQEWLPHVAQHVIRTGMTDFVGLGRMMLSYPDIVADILAGNPIQRKRLCRTFSDCTTAPRNGIVSGCYPLDPFYKERPEYDELMAVKKNL